MAGAEGRVIIPEVERDLANPAWESAGAHILIARLSPWSDVDVSNSHLVLFAETRAAMPDAYIDFAFLPPSSDRAALDRQKSPWFFGRASGRSPENFDLVMVSNAFALELVNLPYLFSTSGLPATSRERASLEHCPIVILGGSNASCTGALVLGGGESGAARATPDYAPRPATFPARDAIPDGIFFGEGEGAVGELARLLADSSRGDRAERLAGAASVEGFWPCLHAPGAKRRTPASSPAPLLSYPVLNGKSASTARLPISSGCPGFCSFCLEGWDRRPYRELPLDSVVEAARRLRRDTGADSLEVYSFNFNTHEDVEALFFELNRIFRRVSFMSQRLDILARSPELARLEMAGGKKSFTLGIEGISGNMRRFYRKGLSEGELEACAEMLLVPGVKEIKLFYIIAGTETEADLQEFDAFAAWLGELRHAHASGVRLIASAGYLVRLPFTPLQFAPLSFDQSNLKRLSARIGESCDKAGVEYRLASDFEEYCVDQCLAMDRGTLFDWLVHAPEKGFVYEGSLSRGAWPSMRSHLRSFGLSDAAFMAEKPADWRPPLAFLEMEERHEVLRRHYEEARDGADRISCLGGSCSDCGACDEGKDRERMLRHSPPRRIPQSAIDRMGRLMTAKSSFRRIEALVEFPPGLAWASDEYRRAWILRKFSVLRPGAERFVFEAENLAFVLGTPFSELLPQGWGQWGALPVGFSGPDEDRLREALSVFGPGHYEAEHWRWLELAIDLPEGSGEKALESLSRMLASQGGAHTETRHGKGGIRLEASAAASGRRVLRSAGLSAAWGPPDLSGKSGIQNTDRITMVVGEKAMLGSWLKQLPLPDSATMVHVMGPARI